MLNGDHGFGKLWINGLSLTVSDLKISSTVTMALVNSGSITVWLILNSWVFAVCHVDSIAPSAITEPYFRSEVQYIWPTFKLWIPDWPWNAHAQCLVSLSLSRVSMGVIALFCTTVEWTCSWYINVVFIVSITTKPIEFIGKDVRPSPRGPGL